jgi:hypothetical protein
MTIRPTKAILARLPRGNKLWRPPSKSTALSILCHRVID